jgi:predicted ATPase
MAAVIGRQFQYRILQSISDTALKLDKHLGSLERVELLSEAARRPELEYMFRHELTRDAAYGSILNRRRQELHKVVGEAIETLFADRLEEHAHRLAQHFKFAGDEARALRYFEMAGDTAASLNASSESVVHFDQAEHAARQLGLGPDVISRIAAKRATAVGVAS